jgi:hypothetical protein
MAFDSFKKALREVMSEPGATGTLSWGRVASSVALVAAIAWVTHMVLITRAIPPLDGVITFTMAPYGNNKVVTAAQSFGNNPVNK